MSTPKGVSHYTFHLANGDKVFIYRWGEDIQIQLRRSIPTETDILQPSLKFAVPLQPEEAEAIAAELSTQARVVERKKQIVHPITHNWQAKTKSSESV